MRAILRGGLFDGQIVAVSELDVQYSIRSGGERVVYDDTGETDPATRRRIFALRPPKPKPVPVPEPTADLEADDE